jgi:hypothetical protein
VARWTRGAVTILEREFYERIQKQNEIG